MLSGMKRLTNSDLAELTRWRREMHRFPELSGEEVQTAGRVRMALTPLGPDTVETDLGGHGLAALFRGRAARRRVMVRCELDGLPIEELSDAPHRSRHPGKGHLCGHDGHMAVLLGLARVLSRARFDHLDVVLLFQPAEETGAGAAAVLAQERFRALAPDCALSLHNVPGAPLGQVGLASGPVNCASRGMRVQLTGKTAHASQPETGASPGLALAAITQGLAAMLRGTPQDTDFRMATVTHLSMGERAFGVAPGAGELWATLRTRTDAAMQGLVARAEALVRDAAEGLGVTIAYHDVFPGSVNDPGLTDLAREALRDSGLQVTPGDLPMRWSEDFGRYAEICPTLMLFPGAGVDTPALHNPDYDFPDDLIAVGTQAFLAILTRLDAEADPLS